MKTAFAGLLVFGLVAFTGCNKGTEGGPGAPTFSTKLKQGESKVVDIGIKRGKNFDEDVALKFDNMPQGVTLDPASPVIKHGDKETKITVKAANDAAVGDFTVKVTGHPTKGADATNDLKLTVQKQ
jgi:uncharacterized membrane protein